MNKDKKIKVAVLVDEYFGGAKTAFGGYGFLARNLVAKYLPCEDIDVEVLLKKDDSKMRLFPKKFDIDGISVYRLAASFMDPLNRWFLNAKNYDVYLSIELTSHSAKILQTEQPHKQKLIHWIQDPRPKADWDEIATVKLFPEHNYWDDNAYDCVHQLYQQNKVRFITQGYCLNNKAKELYRLNDDVDIQYLPNPIEIDDDFELEKANKKNYVIFLGRIESVKRGWLFCEIAKLLPEYQFYVLGQAFRESDRNNEIMKPYMDLDNVHFVGHVEGEEKNRYLREAKVLVNTSIHEALPVSFLEALSFGTLLVSCQNPDELTSKFGVYIGTVLGDGFDSVELFANGVKQLIEGDEKRLSLAQQAIDYIKAVHNIQDFQQNLRQLIRDVARS